MEYIWIHTLFRAVKNSVEITYQLKQLETVKNQVKSERKTNFDSDSTSQLQEIEIMREVKVEDSSERETDTTNGVSEGDVSRHDQSRTMTSFLAKKRFVN